MRVFARAHKAHQKVQAKKEKEKEKEKGKGASSWMSLARRGSVDERSEAGGGSKAPSLKDKALGDAVSLLTKRAKEKPPLPLAGDKAADKASLGTWKDRMLTAASVAKDEAASKLAARRASDAVKEDPEEASAAVGGVGGLWAHVSVGGKAPSKQEQMRVWTTQLLPGWVEHAEAARPAARTAHPCPVCSVLWPRVNFVTARCWVPHRLRARGKAGATLVRRWRALGAHRRQQPRRVASHLLA